MFCSTNKGKRDTTLSYHLCILQSCSFLCTCYLLLVHWLNYEVALAAYFLLWIAWVLDHIVSIYTSMKQMCSWKFLLSLSVVTELLEDKKIAKLGESWYVQNVSTFPNTFVIVLPLICVCWIQLTRTNAVLSRIALVSYFCAENQLSGKSLEIIAMGLFLQKTHGAKRRDGGGPRCAHTSWRRGGPMAAPPHGDATSPSPQRSLLDYLKPLT